ncbi:smf Mn2+ and Fe2+ transporter [Russula aff. rugulosa BPL654]|nr:smf Mn2+ and Fe2+ transporter [Russula aff. rugulosa BPL654]
MSVHPSFASQPTSDSPSTPSPPQKWARQAWIHISKHVGVGIICSVAYFDPGNWGVDLQAGSDFGYKLLFVVLLAGVFAVILQGLSCKLGVVTGLDLAAHCRLLFYNRSRHPKFYRWFILYPLYVSSEIAIISTDLAELLGSAIALNLLFPKLPLWGGVLLTASDVLLVLAFANPLHSRPVRSFELMIGIMVLIVLICMCILVSRVQVEWDGVFKGFLPSNALFKHGGLYTSVGILGATVMPHALFLGSALATQDRASVKPAPLPSMPNIRATESKRFLVKFLDHFRPLRVDTDEFASHADRPNNSLSFIKAHLHHAIVDIVVNLLGLAVIINSLILILAGAVYHQPGVEAGSAGISDAYSLLRDIVGQGAATIFALALLCSGQSASLVATVGGQIVSEGFIRWRVSPLMRRLLTRLLGLIPSIIVAVSVGQAGINAMLVASQVVLSFVLPFIVFPLVWLTSSRTVMRVYSPPPMRPAETADGADEEKSVAEGEYLDFSNGRIVASIGYAIWTVLVLANGYVLIALILGKGT